MAPTARAQATKLRGGEFLALTVDGACATPSVARDARLDGSVDWQELEVFCAASPFVREGLARPKDAAFGASMFFGVKRDGVAVTAADFSDVSTGTASDRHALFDVSSP